MKRSFWFRNARTADLLEILFVSAVASLLLTRFYLQVTGYPSLGGSSLHVAHVLPGGILMLAAIVIAFSFIGYRVQRYAAVVGGIGFGLFIDELGKFITRDNNYFFEPTVAIVYLVFIGLFMAFRSLSRYRHYSSQEYLLNAVGFIEEVAIQDLDAAERARVLEYLRHGDPEDPLTAALTKVFQSLPAESVDRKPSFATRMRQSAERRYRAFITSPWGVRIIAWFFVAKVVLSIAAVIGVIIKVFILDPSANSLNLGTAATLQLLSSLVATAYIIAGIRKLGSDRHAAFELLMRATLIDIFITQLFAFYREEFSALPAFILHLFTYISLKVLIIEERRLNLLSPDPSDEPSGHHPDPAPSR